MNRREEILFNRSSVFGSKEHVFLRTSCLADT